MHGYYIIIFVFLISDGKKIKHRQLHSTDFDESTHVTVIQIDGLVLGLT